MKIIILFSLLLINIFSYIDPHHLNLLYVGKHQSRDQQNLPLTVSQIEKLIKNGTPDNAIAIEIQRRGIDFSLDSEIFESLRILGAKPKTLKALKDLHLKSKQSANQADTTPKNALILVANFNGPEDQTLNVTASVIDELRYATKGYPDITIKALNESISAHQGSEAAQVKGKKHNADIVLWGWYSKSKENILLKVYFEVLQSPPLLHLQQERQSLILPITELDSFSIQMRLSKEMSYLTLLTVGLARIDVNDFDGAIEAFTKALTETTAPDQMIDPSDIYFGRGFAYFCKSIFYSEQTSKLAIADLDKAIEINPKKYKPFALKASLYMVKGQWDLAIAMIDKVIALEPNEVIIYTMRGISHYAKGNEKQGLDDFRRAYELNKCDCKENTYKYVIYEYINAIFFLFNEQFDQGIAHLNLAIKFNKDPFFLPLLLIMRAGAYGGKNDLKKTLEDLNESIKLNPDIAATYYLRALVYNQYKDSQRAVADLTKAIDLSPDSAHFYSERGDVYRKQGQFDESISDYNRSLELDPDQSEVYYSRAISRVYKGELDNAISDLNKYITLDPEDDRGFSYLGYVLTQKGGQSLGLAIESFNQALKLAPDDTYAIYFRGVAYQLIGQHDNAIRDFSRYIELKPKDAWGYYSRVTSHINNGNKDAAISDLKVTIQLTSDAQLVENAKRKLEELGVK